MGRDGPRWAEMGPREAERGFPRAGGAHLRRVAWRARWPPMTPSMSIWPTEIVSASSLGTSSVTRKRGTSPSRLRILSAAR